MFKKEMFPRVKQKPAIPEDYFSLSPQTRINTAVFTFCTLYRSIPLQSTTNLCCSRDKNRVGKWESARWKRLSQSHAEVSSVRYIRILLCYIVCDQMTLKEESVNAKFTKTKCWCFWPILSFEHEDNGWCEFKQTVKEKEAVSSVTFSFDLSLIMAGTSRQSKWTAIKC